MGAETSSAAIHSTDAEHGRVSGHKMKPFSNPYVAGFGLGLVLLAAFVIMGRGLGASGAFSSAVATAVDAVAPQHAQANEFYAGYLGEGSANPLMDWLVFEVIGIFAGGFLSAALAGRIRKTVERGPSISVRGRLVFAFAGGVLMGIGAKLAGGCTSGHMMSGMMQTSLSGYLFAVGAFAAGIPAAIMMYGRDRA